jgi:4-amino-4-deoxy-L-arabinose transferase-like glycosyltransferase
MDDSGRSTSSQSFPVSRWWCWWTRVAWWLGPVVLLLAMTLPHIGDGDWMRGDSAWYAAISLQAWRTGHLWTLMESPGHPYFNKPPLSFWIQGGWMSLLGEGAWQARTATVLAATIGVLATVWIARRLGGRNVALAAGVLLAVNIEYFRRTREISLDMWNAAFMLLAAGALVSALCSREGGRRWMLVVGSGLCVGAALMTKPLIGLGVPVVVCAWAMLAIRGNAEQRTIAVSRGSVALMCTGALVMGATTALPWHLSMISLHDELFTSQYFGREIASRAAGELVGGQKQTQPPWFYLVHLASAWTMWAAAIAMVIATRRGTGRTGTATKFSDRMEDRRTLVLMGIVWTLAWLVALTIFPDRRDRYAMPVHAGMALLLAAVLMPRWRGVGRAMERGVLVAAVLGLVFALIPVRVQREVNPQWPALFAWLKTQGVAARDDVPGATAQNVAPTVLDGSFSGAPAARYYLVTGSWPEPTRDPQGSVIRQPRRGDFILYHRRGGWLPGPGEIEMFSRGDLVATRFEGPMQGTLDGRAESRQWSPVKAPDPGE